MSSVTGQNFGYLVAYVVPGFLLILTIEQVWPGTQPWLEGAATGTTPTVGGFLFVTLASVSAGLTVSAIRWLLIDPLHHRTGIRPPVWNDSNLQDKLAAFEALVAAHYRYYQFYANTLVSMIALLFARVASGHIDGLDAVLIGLCLLYWAGSRDTLRRYYRRTELLLGASAQGVADDQRTSPKEEPGQCRGEPIAAPVTRAANPSERPSRGERKRTKGRRESDSERRG